MNNYVLISKKTESSNHVIDSASDNLEQLSRRMSSLNSKGYYENKIFQLNSLSTGKEYVNDSIETIARSMTRYQFYPIYRIRTFINGVDNLSMTTYFMSNDLILSKEDFNKVIGSINESVTEMLNKCRINRLIKDVVVNKDSLYHKYKLIGMDSWIIDPIGSYFTNSSNLKDSELKESFSDYMSRHTESLASIDSDDESMAFMDFSRFVNRRVEDFPICDKYISKFNEVKIEKFRKVARLYVDE